MIIAAKYDLLAIVKVAMYLLFPSSPFVIFCEFMEPLVECYDYLHDNGLAIRMQLCDTWKREFQTLPGRFHPEMRMPTSGGYLLSGIYISCRVQTGKPGISPTEMNG